MTKAIPAAVLVFLAILLAVATLTARHDSGMAQERATLDADTNPIGNTATALGPRDECISVKTGDTFPFDIVVSSVESLIAWELYVQFTPSIIEFVDADMEMFLASNQRSSLKVLSVPLSDGRHFLGAADLRNAPESGSGVLARLTLRATSPGLSPAIIMYHDVDDDGDKDFGPRLTAAGGLAVGDVTGDGVFDGPTRHALIAVDIRCGPAPPAPTLPPSPTPRPNADGSGSGSPGGTTGGSPDGEGEGPGATGDPGDPGAPSDGGGGEGPAPEPGDGATPDPDSEDGLPPVVRSGERTPVPYGSGGDGGQGQPSGGGAGGGGMPWWTIGVLLAAALLIITGAGVYVTGRSTGGSES